MTKVLAEDFSARQQKDYGIRVTVMSTASLSGTEIIIVSGKDLATSVAIFKEGFSVEVGERADFRVVKVATQARKRSS